VCGRYIAQKKERRGNSNRVEVLQQKNPTKKKNPPPREEGEGKPWICRKEAGKKDLSLLLAH